jgi:hypothetical protein
LWHRFLEGSPEAAEALLWEYLESIEQHFVERRLYMDLDTPAGSVRISGQVDYAEPVGAGWALYDWKTTKVWSAIYKSHMDDWTRQANCYAQLMRENEMPPAALNVVALYLDWTPMRARFEPDHPQAPCEVIPLELWSEPQALAYMRERWQAHQAANDNLPECTAEERWARPDRWAVKRDGRKRASAVFDSELEAYEYIAERDYAAELTVEHRPGESVRCAGYCAVADFCSQWAAEKAAA